MEYTLYIGSKKAKHDIRYTFSKHACAILSGSNEDIIWTKHQNIQEGIQGVTKHICCPNYIKESNQHKICSTKFNK